MKEVWDMDTAMGQEEEKELYIERHSSEDDTLFLVKTMFRKVVKKWFRAVPRF